MNFQRTLRYLCCINSNTCILENDSNYLEPVCIIDYAETVPFIPPIDCGQVIKVFDGNTITIASKLPYSNSPLYRFQVRLRNIDYPKIKDKNQKYVAEIEKKELEMMVLHKYVDLKNIGTEKYGRILADIYLKNIHINNYLLEKRAISKT